MDDDTDISECSACQLFGHDYEDVEERPGIRRCSDCGDEYEA